MKKILACLLAVLLISTLSTTVLAGWEIEADNQKITYEFAGAADKPVIDGKLDEFGYAKLNYTPSQLSYAYNDSTTGADAIAKGQKFDVYVSYDATTVYFFVSADTKYYFQDNTMDTAGNIWAQSAIQVSLSKPGASGTENLEIGIGRNSVSGELLSTVWMPSPYAAQEMVFEAGKNFQIVIDGANINYELAIPFKTFTENDLKQGDKLGFCLVVAQCDKELGEGGGTGGYLHTQIASGCTGNGKTAENFAQVTLGAAIVKPEPTTVAEAAPDAPAADDTPAAAPTKTNPTTGDMSTALIVVMLVAAVSFVVIKKRVNVK